MKTTQRHRFYHLLAILSPFLALAAAIPAAIKAEEPIVVAVLGKQIRLSSAEWIAMKNEESYAKNFEARNKSQNEVFPQIVTVFLIEMSPDCCTGTKLSDSEHVEFFTVHPDSVTVQVRREKKGYWILSRQTFALTRGAPISGATLKHDYSDHEITPTSPLVPKRHRQDTTALIGAILRPLQCDRKRLTWALERTSQGELR